MRSATARAANGRVELAMIAQTLAIHEPGGVRSPTSISSALWPTLVSDIAAVAGL